jgi:hypothetical protein
LSRSATAGGLAPHIRPPNRTRKTSLPRRSRTRHQRRTRGGVPPRLAGAAPGVDTRHRQATTRARELTTWGIPIDHRRPVGVRASVNNEARGQRVGRIRRPRLPCLDHRDRGSMRPDQVKARRGRCGDRVEDERRDDTDVGGTRAAQRPEQVWMMLLVALDDAAVRQHDDIAMRRPNRLVNRTVSATSTSVTHRTTACGRRSWKRTIAGLRSTSYSAEPGRTT